MTRTCISPREKEVLDLIAYENSTKMIAKELFISEHTVISHRKNLMAKLNASNTAGLVRKAYESGVLNLSRQMAALILLCLSLSLSAQQQEIRYNSDSKLSTNGPHLLITETGDPGDGINDDGFSRIWLKNNSHPNYWSFAARPHGDATDRDGILPNPIVVAYGDVDTETRIQKFGIGSDGTIRINKQYTLPNMAGDVGQFLSIVDDTNPLNAVADWVNFPLIITPGFVALESGNSLVVPNGNISANGNINANGDLEFSGFLRGNGVDVRVAAGENLAVGGGNLNVNGNGNFSGTVQASCGVLTCSDIRYKTNIQPIENALSKVQDLEGVYFDMRAQDFPEMNFGEETQVGVIAQNIETQFPELVRTNEDGYKVVAYDRLAPILIEALKEQQAIIDRQSNELSLIKTDLQNITDMLSQIQDTDEQSSANSEE
jgi:DNA-binding CsgD family transcriptional regulator